MTDVAAEQLKKLDAEGLIVIGGNGSRPGAHAFAPETGIKVMGIHVLRLRCHLRGEGEGEAPFSNRLCMKLTAGEEVRDVALQ